MTLQAEDEQADLYRDEGESTTSVVSVGPDLDPQYQQGRPSLEGAGGGGGDDDDDEDKKVGYLSVSLVVLELFIYQLSHSPACFTSARTARRATSCSKS